MTDEPQKDKIYKLTAGPGEPCIAAGNTWEESAVDPIENMAKRLEKAGLLIPLLEPERAVRLAVECMKGGGSGAGNRYAACFWVPGDIKSLRPGWSLEKCDEWLHDNKRQIQNDTTERGWDSIHTLLEEADDAQVEG
jgi:hypothetical protein